MQHVHDRCASGHDQSSKGKKAELSAYLQLEGAIASFSPVLGRGLFPCSIFHCRCLLRSFTCSVFLCSLQLCRYIKSRDTLTVARMLDLGMALSTETKRQWISSAGILTERAEEVETFHTSDSSSCSGAESCLKVF